MASSKSFIILCVVVLIIITWIEQVESRKCIIIKTGLPCTKKCCGKGPRIFTCKDDCKNIACDSDGDCGGGCCKDDKCEDCPLLSNTVIIIIAVCAMVILVSIIVASICCCHCCRGQTTQVVVGQWNTLQNQYENMPEQELKC